MQDPPRAKEKNRKEAQRRSPDRPRADDRRSTEVRAAGEGHHLPGRQIGIS